MMNPTVPVIGPKVTVVGSKVTEMLKRKLQQRLLAEKAKKVRTSSSEDEREAGAASGNGPVATSGGGSSSDHLMFVQGVTTTSCPGSVSNMNSVIIHNSFIMQNSHSQNALRTSLDANKNKVSKPKSSKSKKSPKTPAPKCVAVGADTGVSAGAVVYGSTCNDGTSTKNAVTCSINNTPLSPELRKKCTSIALSNAVAQPLHLTTQLNGASFTNGFYPFHPGLHKSNFVVSCEDKKLGFPGGMFISSCTGNKVSSACSPTTDGIGGGELLGSALGSVCTGDYDNCLIPVESGEGAMEIPLAAATKTGILKDTADGDYVHKFPDGQSKKSSGSEPVNPSLIDSSLWPLIYGENSKQLDDYIHRIYCRDCQKSQEQRPLGNLGDGDRHTSKTSVRSHVEVNKCQLQHLKDVNEANLCSSLNNHQCNGESTEMVLPPEEIGDVLSSSGKTTPSVQFQDRMALNLFQDQSTLQLSGGEDGLNLDSSQSMILDASRKTDNDTEASSSKSSSASSTSFVNSTSINLSDTRSTKSKKSSSKAIPKASNKVIKFHEYKGPPNVSRPTCTITMPPAVRSPPLKDDLFQKLQQRQLCLQMQLQLEFRNRGLLASLGSSRLSTSCDISKIGQVQVNGARGALGATEQMGMEPMGQPAVAQVPFSSSAAAAAAAASAMVNGKTPILLQSIPSVMTSPSKFVLSVGSGSHPLQPNGMLSVTTAGSQCIPSSSSSSPSSLLISSSASSSPSSSSVGGAFSAASASSTWPQCQSVQHWNNAVTQSDKMAIPDTSMKPVTGESTMPGGWQHHLMATSAASCGAAVSSVGQAAATSQSAAALVASAMTSAPILYASGKVLPNQAASLVPNASKTKVSVGCSQSCGGNRSATVVIPTRLEDVKVADLKAECRKRKLVVSGPKPNLIERLRPYEDDILHCLAVNLRATLQDPDSLKADKNASSTNIGDQTSSPSSLTSMDSVVNIQPLCHLNDDDSSAGELIISPEKPDMAAAAVRSSVTGTDQLASGKIKQSLASTLRNHMTSQMSLSLNLSPTVTAATGGSSSKSGGHCQIPPIQFVGNSIGGINIPSSLGSFNFATSAGVELAHKASMTSADQPVTFAPSRPSSVSFALPSVSQWYRMPPPLAVASIPVVSNPSLPPPLRLFPPTCFVATPSNSTVSMCQSPVMNAAFRCRNPLSSPFAIPLSSACLTNPCPGHALVIQSTTSSPRPSIQSGQVVGTGRSPNMSQPQSATTPDDFNNRKDNHLMISCSPTDNPSTPWSTICHSKPLDASGCLDVLNGVSHHLIQPSEILSSSDLLSWQQQQIMELQKQLHLSRLQLLETHRRVWEQQEQFQVNISAPAQSSALAAYATGVPSSLVSSRNTALSVEQNSTLAEQMGFQCDALQDIPKLGEAMSCDVTQELFEDFAMGMNPLTSGIKELEADMSCHSSPGLDEAFADSACAEMLSKEIGDQDSIDIGQLTKTFLSAGIETSTHSMLCSIGSNGSANKTSSKENIPDMLSPAEQPEKRDNGSFYLSVPLKEPPKYDDVVKGKQISSSVSASSSVAMDSNSVDDLLQMLMRQTDMLMNTNNMSDHALSSGSDILTNTSPLTFTSPMSHSTQVDDLTTQELDAYPYSAGSNSSSGISTAPSTCGDLLSDPLSSSGMSTSMFSEIPFQLPDWTDSEFLELSMLGRMKLDQADGGINRAQHGTPDIPMVLPPLSSAAAANMTSEATPPCNDYDPCLAGFVPSYAADSLGLTDLLDVSVPSLPPSDMANVSRSYDVLEDLFIMEDDDLFHIRDPTYLIGGDRRLGVSSISRT